MGSRSRTYIGTFTAGLNTYTASSVTFSRQNAEGFSTESEGEFVTGLSITNNTDETYNIKIDSTGSTILVHNTRLLPRTTTQILTANDKLSLNLANLEFTLQGPTGRNPSATAASNTDQVCVAVTYTFRRES